MQSVRSRIWTRVAVSISCDDNLYTTGITRIIIIIIIIIAYIISVSNLLAAPFVLDVMVDAILEVSHLFKQGFKATETAHKIRDLEKIIV